jgi:phospholipid transport system transporter-binding protein
MAILSFNFLDRQYVRVKGALTFASIDVKTLEKIDFKQREQLTIDLSEIVNSNSAGLALIIEWKKLSKQHNTRLMLTHIPKQLTLLAELSGLKDL